MTASSCPLCRQRKGKRACPARGAAVCAHCCGTKRRIEVDCPSDCVFLDGTHARGWQYRRGELLRDIEQIGPYLEPLSEPGALLFQAILHETGTLLGRHPATDDALLLDAIRSLRKTLATRQSGLVYDHPPEDARAAALVRELDRYFGAGGDADERVAPDPRDASAVLEALERAIVGASRSDQGPRAFVARAARLAARFPLPVPPPERAGLVGI